MNTLFIYMVKAAVYLIAFYLVYSIMLSRDTNYVRNRIFILLSLASALILPLIIFQTIKPMNIQLFGILLSEVFISATSKGVKSLNEVSSTTSPLQIVSAIYITGVIFFLSKLIIELLNLLILIIRQKNKGSRIIRFHRFNTSGFSAMGYIFINTRLSPEEEAEIIRHEQNHLRKNHFTDIIFIETIKAFQWFNPVVYLFNRSLRAIHEYQADHECLCSGVPVVNYQTLLLKQVFKSGAFNLTSSFSNPSLIKKRMIMMTKKRTSALASLKLIILLPVIGFVFLAISAYQKIPDSSDNQIVSITNPQSTASGSSVENVLSPASPKMSEEEATEESKEVPFIVVEEMPQFSGGQKALFEYLNENTQYPAEAKEKNIQGKVIVKFCVTATGGISQVKILKGVSPELDAEAIRVVKTLPSFKPGKQDGKAVPVWFSLPINFKLN